MITYLYTYLQSHTLSLIKCICFGKEHTRTHLKQINYLTVIWFANQIWISRHKHLCDIFIALLYFSVIRSSASVCPLRFYFVQRRRHIIITEEWYLATYFQHMILWFLYGFFLFVSEIVFNKTNGFFMKY